MSGVYKSNKPQGAGRVLCPKDAIYAFEALYRDGKRLGVVFCYKGVIRQQTNACYFYAPFQTSRQVEASEPITLYGEVLGMMIAWIGHDVATRVFVDEDKFIEELSLVGTAFFLEQSVEKVGAVKMENKADDARKIEPNK